MESEKSMSTTQRMIVAIFTDRPQAEQAINALLNAGFTDDQIRYSGNGTSDGGVFQKIKSLFTGEGTSGSVYDDLTGMGMPQNDASYFQSEYEAGRSIVAVLADGRGQEASDILAQYGGYGATRRSQQTTDYNANAATMPATETEGEQSLKLREEQLRVQKQPVQTGEARLRKDVVSEQQSMDVPVTHEEVYVERRPGSGQASDTPIGESETYRVPVSEEQVTVEKQPVVREEVALGKRKVQDTQQVSDTVRREEAHVERAGDVNVQGSDVEDVFDQPDQNTP
jgi:uncharacterized protein (TIGR02271 family)